MDMQVRLSMTVQRDALVKALALVTAFVDKRSYIPILSCVLIRADGAVTLTGTNLDKTITVPLSSSEYLTGVVAVPAHNLYQLVKGLPKGATVTLTQETDRLAIASGAARFDLPTRAIEDFPAEPLTGRKSTFTLTAPLLREMIAKTKMAMSTEQTRYYLNGLCFNVQATRGTLYAAACDGHRLAEFTMPTPAGAETFTADDHAAGIIIPRDTVLTLEKILPKAGDVRIALYAERLTFGTSEWQVVSKAIAGTFPDWKRAIPSEGHALRFDSLAAQQLIANVTAIASCRGRAVRMVLTADALQMSFFDPENGAASGSIPARWAGAELEIGFNGSYLSEILKLIPGEAEMYVTDAGTPARFIDPADPRVQFVLMPMCV